MMFAHPTAIEREGCVRRGRWRASEEKFVSFLGRNSTEYIHCCQAHSKIFRLVTNLIYLYISRKIGHFIIAHILSARVYMTFYTNN